MITCISDCYAKFYHQKKKIYIYYRPRQRHICKKKYVGDTEGTKMLIASTLTSALIKLIVPKPYQNSETQLQR